MKLKTAIAVHLFAFALLFSLHTEASLLTKLQWKAEKHFGKATKQEIEAEYGFIEDPALDGWMNRLGASLAAVSHRADIPWEFHIVDSDEMNAFAAPGGFVFVTRGLIEEAESDDELAAVVGHEVGHVAANHGAKRIKKLPFIIVGMNILQSKYGETAARVGGVVLSLFQLHYSREDEYQADQLGVEYSLNGGYDPAGMESFFAKLEKKHRTGGLGRLEVAISSHPKTPSRIREIRNSPAARETPENLMRVGDSYMARYYYHEAAEKYRRALELEPGSERARGGLAEAGRNFFDAEDAEKPGSGSRASGFGEEQEQKNLDAENAEKTADSRQYTVDRENTEKTGRSSESGEEQNLFKTRDPEPEPRNPESELLAAISSVQDTLNDYEARRAKIDGKIVAMERGFGADLPAMSETFAAAAGRDVAGEEVYNYAGRYYSLYVSALRVAGDAAREIERDLRETRTRAREVLFAIRTRPDAAPEAAIEAFISAAGEQTAGAWTEAEALDEAIAGISRSYAAMKKEVELLANQLQYEDATLGYWERRSMLAREVENLDAIVREFERMTQDRAASRDAAVEMRAAALGIAASLLTPGEDAIYRKMLARRFGLDDAALAAASGNAERPLGYFDAILSMGRDGVKSQSARDAEEQSIPGAESLVSPDALAASRDASAKKLILHLAEIDLKHLTRSPDLGARLLPPEDFTASYDSAMAAAQASQRQTDAELDRAEALLRTGAPEDAAEAEKIIHERGKSAPATARAHLLLGIAYKNTDKRDEALREFSRAEKKGIPRRVTAHLMGNAYLELEAYPDALAQYMRAMREDAADPAPHAGAGYALAMTGEDEKAKESFNRAVALAPAGCAARNNLAILLYKEGLIAEAEEQFGMCGKDK